MGGERAAFDRLPQVWPTERRLTPPPETLKRWRHPPGRGAKAGRKTDRLLLVTGSRMRSEEHAVTDQRDRQTDPQRPHALYSCQAPIGATQQPCAHFHKARAPGRCCTSSSGSRGNSRQPRRVTRAKVNGARQGASLQAANLPHEDTRGPILSSASLREAAAPAHLRCMPGAGRGPGSSRQASAGVCYPLGPRLPGPQQASLDR